MCTVDVMVHSDSLDNSNGKYGLWVREFAFPCMQTLGFESPVSNGDFPFAYCEAYFDFYSPLS